MYWNTGRAPDEGSNAGKVVWMPMGVIATGVGARGDQVRFADLDGDGRAEYIWYRPFLRVRRDQGEWTFTNTSSPGSRTRVLLRSGGISDSTQTPRPRSLGTRLRARISRVALATVKVCKAKEAP